ncbi:MAG: hypothetical protein L6Q38_09630, partial [Nitrospira sp.]|nr:hypothetical protein [Nitrospira sp.]
MNNGSFFGVSEIQGNIIAQSTGMIGGNIRCFGSQIRLGNDSNGTFYLSGPGAKTLEVNGTVYFQGLTIDGPSGSSLEIVGDDIDNFANNVPVAVAPGNTVDIETFIRLGRESKLENWGTVNLKPGSVIDEGYYKATDLKNHGTINQIGSGVLKFSCKGVAFTDNSGMPVSILSVGEAAYITLIDVDENVDGQNIDTCSVVVHSPSTNDTEILVLPETDLMSGEFRNAAGLPTASGAASVGDGILQYDGVENLEVTYVDDEDSDDQASGLLHLAPMYYTGWGAGEFPESWTGNRTPTRFDTLILDDNMKAPGSWTDCHFQRRMECHKMILAPTYTGSVTVMFGGDIYGDLEIGNGLFQVDADEECLIQGNVTMSGGRFAPTGTVEGNLVKTGGTIDDQGFARQLFVKGDFQESAGGVSWQNSKITFSRDSEQLARFGANVSINDLSFEGANAHVVRVSGTPNTEIADGTVYVGPGIEVRIEDPIALGKDSRLVVDGQLIVEDGAELDADLSDRFTNYGLLAEIGTGKILRGNKGIGITDTTGFPVPFSFSAPFSVTLVDEDENVDAHAFDQVLVRLRNLENGDEEYRVLYEAGLARDEFRNLDPIAVAPGPAVPGNGILEGSGRERINLEYVDDNDPSDSVSVSDFDVQPREADFGTQEIPDGASEPITVTISNPNAQDLSLSEISIGDSGAFAALSSAARGANSRGAASFAFLGAPDMSPIPPGQSRTIKVVFDPQASGPIDADLFIDTNNPVRPSFTAKLSGIGSFPPIAVIGGASVVTIGTGDGLSLDGSSSSDPDGTIDSWTWDF